ncbi:30S ribosomal protein S7 [uncultured bacterium]|nr:30S ribosomal protein S7 [uncultured bacterium]
MNRSKVYKKRITKPDIVYKSVVINRFIGKLMKNGKKLKISNIIYEALEILSKELNSHPIKILEDVVNIIKPEHRLRNWRIASKIYPLPYAIKDKDVAEKQSIDWITKAIRQRPERGLLNKIICEIRDILNGSGISKTFLQKRREIAKEYEAYVHYGS